MQSRLGGMARIWHSSLPRYDLSWEEWKNEFMKAFPSIIDYPESLRVMLSRRKTLNETMTHYFYQKNAMLTKLEISGDKAVACIIDGLPAFLRAPARAGNYKTPTDLHASFLCVMEDSRAKNNFTRNETGKTSATEYFATRNAKDPITCYTCGGAGHTSRRCHKNRCSNCGKNGHPTGKCIFKKYEVNKDSASSSVNYITNEVNRTYFIPVHVNEVRMLAYLDSGAKINAACPEIAKSLGLNLKSCDMSIGGFGGRYVKAQGLADVDIKINNILFRTTLTIVDLKLRNIQLILGQPIINNPRIRFIVNGTNLTIEEALPEVFLIEDFPTEKRVEIFCKQDTIVPPLSKMIVETCIENARPEDYVFIENRTCRNEVRDYTIPATMLSGESGIINVQNNSRHPLLLEEKDLLARGDKWSGMTSAYKKVEEKHVNILSVDFKKIQCDTKNMNIKEKLEQLIKEYTDCFSSSTSMGENTLENEQESQENCERAKKNIEKKAVEMKKSKIVSDANDRALSNRSHVAPFQLRVLRGQAAGDGRLRAELRRVPFVTGRATNICSLYNPDNLLSILLIDFFDFMTL
ncbi:unnamed protein product, partial [Brenthis ino]